MDLSLLRGFEALARRCGNGSYRVPVPAPVGPEVAAEGSDALAMPRLSLSDPFLVRLFDRPVDGGGDAWGTIVAALLPPPAADAPRSAFGAWLAGEFHHPLAPVIVVDPGSDRAVAEMMEIEARVFADASGALADMGARRPCDMTVAEADAAWLESLPVSLSPEASKEAVKAFAAAVAEGLRQHDPKAAEVLAALGAALRISPRLADVLARARAGEADWLRHGPPGGAAVQCLLGAPTPSASLRDPMVLRRAAILHLFMGKAITAALRDAIIELRFAQLCDLAPETWVIADEVEAQIVASLAAAEDMGGMTRRLVAACLRGDALADPVELFERFAERAAIREYEGGEARPEAEREAMRELARELGLHPSDLVRAWSLVPALYPRLSRLTFRTSPLQARTRG